MKAKTLIPVCVAALLSACGGGGGGDAGSTTTTAAASGVQITSANATEASVYSYSAMEDVNSQGTIGSGLAAGVSIDALPNGLLQSALNQVYFGTATQAASAVAAGVTMTQSANCAGGGTATVTINAAGTGQVQSGDSLSINANNCYESGELINGHVDFVFSNVTGVVSSSGAWSAGMRMNFSSFTVQTGGTTVKANGDMTIGYAQSGYGAWAAQLSGSSISVDMTKSDASVIKRTLSNYKLSSMLLNGVTTFSGDFTLAGTSPKLGNVAFSVKTNSPFKIAAGNRNPSTGSATITGAAGSSATVTVLDSANVRIAIDKNGDGVTDETVDTTWDGFRSHL